MTIHMVCRDNRTSPVSVVILVDVPTSQAEKRVAMEGQAAGSGLTLSHLCVAAQRGGERGLHRLLGEKMAGKVRVTSSKKMWTKSIASQCRSRSRQKTNVMPV